MWAFWAVCGAAAVIALASAVLGGGIASRKRRQSRAALALAREIFHWRREWLEADFLTMLSESKSLQGLSWSDCEFDDDVAFARDRGTGRLCGLVAITLKMESSGARRMADVETVGVLRAGTAVFTFDGQRWFCDGRTIFNLNPRETIRRYRRELEVME
jgi:hypothetical protein